MKRVSTMTVCLLICVCTSAQHVPSIGIDIGTFLKTAKIRITASHGFSAKWSASFSAEFDTGRFHPEKDAEQEGHEGEFSDMPAMQEISERGTMTLQYWTDAPYQGAYLEIGCRCMKGNDADCVIGIGYSIPVWKGIHAVVSYGSDLISSFRSGKPEGTGLTITLCWAITKR